MPPGRPWRPAPFVYPGPWSRTIPTATPGWSARSSWCPRRRSHALRLVRASARAGPARYMACDDDDLQDDFGPERHVGLSSADVLTYFVRRELREPYLAHLP